jgi:phosphatidylglycerol lysyltransferase
MAGIAAFAAAVFYLHAELRPVSWREVASGVRSYSALQLILSACFAVAGYLVLTGYDALALKYVRQSIPYQKYGLASFMASAIGHGTGFSVVTGGSIRYRLYSAIGLTGGEIVRIIAFCSVTFTVGASLLLGLAMLSTSAGQLVIPGLPAPAVRVLGAMLTCAAAAYVFSPLVVNQPLRFRDWQIEVPRISMTWRQLVVATSDLSLAAGTLYVLLRPSVSIEFLPFLGIYLIAVAAGMLSNLPGGIGVFEAVLLVQLPQVDREILLGSLIVYRLIYYVTPLTIAIALLGWHELRPQRTAIGTVNRVIVDTLTGIAPYAFSLLIFLAGIVLLISGSTPSIEARLAAVGRLIPHPLLESAHLAGSLLGLGLLVLSRGLFRRLNSAYRLTVGVLLAGSVVSLIKGFDFEESAMLLLICGLIWTARDEFYRRGSSLTQSFPLKWLAAIAMAVSGSAWIVLISFGNVEYSNELLWQFSLDGDAPRALRASVLVGAAALVFSVWKLMRPAPPASGEISPQAIEDIRRIVKSAQDPSANAALIGDKRFLLSEDRSAFIMYQIHNRSWIALGDPVGNKRLHEQLAFQFIELADRFDGWPAFYQVTDESLALYVDLGLSMWKLGEEGRVSLRDFSLSGKERADLRHAQHRAERHGLVFSVLRSDQVSMRLPELRSVSDNWLATKAAAEKGFSLGAFSEAYLSQFDVAIVSIGDRIIAFANLWQAPAARELSVDLMRYLGDAPNGTMDFLFAELILFAKAEGFDWFSLGMAPLSGLDGSSLAPMWQRVGNAVFRYADEYYNFEGLRTYKEKFGPSWQPRYLACPGGATFPRVLYDTTVLIAGGLRSAVSK